MNLIDNVNSGQQIDGLNAKEFSKKGFAVRDPSNGKKILTAFLEKDGSVGMIIAELIRIPLKQDKQVLLSPGEKLADVRILLGDSLVKDTGETLIWKTSEGWVSCGFLKDVLIDITMAASSRGPVSTETEM